eukprot:10587905-Heterocapsa_arctica.AAC.1
MASARSRAATTMWASVGDPGIHAGELEMKQHQDLDRVVVVVVAASSRAIWTPFVSGAGVPALT